MTSTYYFSPRNNKVRLYSNFNWSFTLSSTANRLSTGKCSWGDVPLFTDSSNR